MRRLATLGVLLAATGLVVACGGDDAGDDAAADTTPVTTTAGADPSASSPQSNLETSAAAEGLGPSDEEVKIRFGVFPNITHAPGLVALSNGSLEELLPNATVEVNSFNSGTTAVEALFNDALDITYIGPNPALNAYAKSNGEAVRIVSGTTSGGAYFVVKPEISSAADLKGKKIATPSLGNTQDVALRTWLAEQGLKTDTAGGGDVSIVPQENSQTLETFLAGTIDGAWVPEPWATRLIDEGGAKVLVDERDLWPDRKYVTTHLVVATKFLDEHPEVVKRILLANAEAIDFVNENPTEAQALVNDQIEAFTDKRVKDEVLTKAWENLDFTVDPVAGSLQKSAKDAEALGFIDPIDDLAGIYDLTLLNDVLSEQGREPVSGL